MPTFRLFDIPVKVHPTFLVIALVLGWINELTDWRLMVAWVGIVFVSVLIHEFGHALTARSFGAVVEVELNGLGGLTRWGVPQGDLPPGRRAVVSAAGSVAGFILGGAVFAVWHFWGPFGNPIVDRALPLLIYVNFFWGILNWLPIRPLDGGHLLISLLAKLFPRNAERVAKVVFAVTSAIALILAIQLGLFFLAILAGWMLLAELMPAPDRTSAPRGLPELSYDTDPAPEEPDRDEHG